MDKIHKNLEPIDFEVPSVLLKEKYVNTQVKLPPNCVIRIKEEMPLRMNIS